MGRTSIPVDLEGLARQVLSNELDPRWADDALCAQVDPELFHPEKGSNPQPAIRLCQTCPVMLHCLETAVLLNPDDTGVWGATTPRQRAQIRRVIASLGDAQPLSAAARQRALRTEAIAKMMADDVPVSQIADELGITTRTAHRYMAQVRERFNGREDVA